MVGATATVIYSILAGIVTQCVRNIVKQLYFPDRDKPPVVFHWLPLIGSTIYYGMDPYKFFFECREKVDPTIYFNHHRC
jgi:sterol 14-demethylase